MSEKQPPKTGIDLYQIALLIDQLKHDDVQIRANASRSLTVIAKALGPERSREELIPFLCESADDEDEVLLILAEKLGEMCACVGGDEHVHRLLAPLELLATVEESAVREMTLRSIEIVANKMPEDHVAKYFRTFIVRLSSKDWFTSRISAASLFHVAYKLLPESEKRSLRALFLRLCADETPSVRRAAAQNFGNLVKQVKPAEVLSEFLSTFNNISVDEQDSVRIQVITTCITLADILTPEQQAAHVLPVVLAVGSDKSWRVRWSLATRLHELCRPLGEVVANESLSAVFESLLSDSEAEVRSAAAGRIAIVSSFLRKSTVISRVLPVVQRLVTDASEHVRASLACVVNHLATSLGKDDTVERLLPIILLLLRDEVSEVRLNIISNLDAMNTVVSIDLLSQSLLPAIVDLAEDSKWRVRLAIIELIPVLAKQLGKEYFGDKLSPLCMAWLDDTVYSIRRAATENLLRLAELFGEDWATEHILPRVDRMRGHKNYLHRTTALYALQVLVRCLSQSVIEKAVLPLVLQMTDDTVPNIRFIAAKTLEAIATRCQNLSGSGPAGYTSSAVAAEISTALSKLLTDPDRDVKYYANQVSAQFNDS